LDSKTAVKITTARYFTPSGHSIQAKGIIPDIIVKPLRLQRDKKEGDDTFVPLSEADLKGHLSNPESDQKSDKKRDDKTKEIKKSADKAKKDNPSDENLAAKDYLLYEALNVLKSMSLIQSRK
jgi:carboxyl-terminal processing protease